MIFSDLTIKESINSGRISVYPYDRDAVQPASIDLSLAGSFLVFRNYKHSCIDPRVKQEDLTDLVTVRDGDPFIIHPGEFVLASTKERVRLGTDVAAQLGGKSSLGRIGLIVHATAGFIDPGFDGCITLELSNVANLPIKLWPSMKVAQVLFFDLTTPCERPYGSTGLGSKYIGQLEPTASKIYLNF